ncbi:tRNA lysidine(34) synthetase TilS [Roseburia hominis]
MVHTVKEYIQRYHMLAKDDVVIAGVSGGADSMCLLLVLEELAGQMDFRLAVVHVNHMLRGADADADERYVAAFCSKRGIPFEAFHVDVSLLAKERGLSFEEAGRMARREAFLQAAGEYGERKGKVRIALAHHREDNAETFLMNLARGSRLKGLGGISPVNGMWIHPLLCVGREEIEKFLEEKKVSYCMDATNLEDTYTRNRIRRNVLPVLTEQVNNRAVEHMNGAIEQLREVWRYLEGQTKEAYRECVRTEEEHKILLETVFLALDEVIQSMVLYHLLEDMAGQAKDIEERHVHALRELMDKQTGRAINLPYGMRALRVYDGIEIWREKEGKDKAESLEAEELKIEIGPGEAEEYHFKERTILVRVFPRPKTDLDIPKKTYTKWFDYGIIEQGLTIRTRRAGDQLVIDRNGSSKKLKKLLIDEKIPSRRRDEILLAADGSRILWAVGVRQSMAYQVTQHTKNILEITIR